MQNPVEIYQIKIWLRNISPSILRRLLIRSDSTIAELHYIIQIVMGWPDLHLHQFTIRGKEYGISYAGGIGFSDNPRLIPLDKLKFRPRERFVYEYNFHDKWCHEIRIENILPFNNNRTYPVCISGKRSAPPDECGGAWSFMALRSQYPPGYVAYRVLEILKENSIEENQEEFDTLKYWLQADQFDRKAVNNRLYRYAVKKEDPQELICEVEQCI